ncbi:MAG: hypothetical protein GF383_08365 [Candidatus Lokiarchaeota archaeon]|nr:hypothetical protein [Candidatus Lokiarchaeota archaeon]MBD3340367.1 hypothetical protein [Candidatus Lokiarchaeota archaeon]
MSTPVSVSNGPFSTNYLISKKFVLVYLFIIWLSFLPLIIQVWFFFYFWRALNSNIYLFFIILPFEIILGYFVLFFSSLITSKGFLGLANIIHKPKEGVFRRKKSDKDFYFWNLRAVIKKWPVWLARIIPLPFLETILYKCFGVKTNFSNSLYHGSVDTEFIEFGNNVVLGKSCYVKSSLIYRDFLVIKKIVIEDKVMISSHSYVSPGTRIKSNTILNAYSMTTISQILEENSIYSGYPAIKKSSHIKNFTKADLENAFFDSSESTEEKTSLINLSKRNSNSNQKFIKQIHIYLLIFFLSYIFSYGLPIYLLLIYLQHFFYPYVLSLSNPLNIFLNFNSLIIFLLSPIVVIGFVLLNLSLVLIVVKLIYCIIKKLNPPREGIFNWKENTKEYRFYFIRSFLMRYIKWKIQRSPFPFLIKPVFNFLGNCHFGKYTVIEDMYVAKEFFKVGNNVYLGKIMTANHLWDKELTVKGLNIEDNSVILDGCCVSPGTHIGKNVTLLPLSITSKCDTLNENLDYLDAPAEPISNDKISSKFNLDVAAIKSAKGTSIRNEKHLNQYSKTKNPNFTHDDIVTCNNVKERRFSLIYLVLMWFSLFFTISIASLFFIHFLYIFHPLILIIILPLLILLYYVLFILVLVLICRLFLILINLMHKPREGIFIRSLKDMDYFCYCFRKTIKMLLLKIYNFFPLPWAKILALKASNLKISSSSGVLDSYIDSDFIEFGRNTILGEGSVIMSSMIVGDYLLLKSVLFNEGSTIGANSLIAPGTIFGRNSILGLGSYTKINQKLESGWIYIGRPAVKFKKLET